jgi:hypothetical protein
MLDPNGPAFAEQLAKIRERRRSGGGSGGGSGASGAPGDAGL